MAWYVSPALAQLDKQINAAAPNRRKGSDGTIGDALTKSPADTTAWCGVRALSAVIALAM